MRLHINFSVILPFLTAVAKYLVQYGVMPVSGFVYGKDSIRDLKQMGFHLEHLGILTEEPHWQDDRSEPDLDYLMEKERQYGVPNLYPMITACRFVSRFDRRRALRVLESGFRLVERLFDEAEPDFIISDGVACALSYIQYAVAEKRSIPYLTIADARINGRFYVIRNRSDRYERTEELFAQYKSEGLPASLRAKAQAFLDHFRRTASKPKYFLDHATVPALNTEAVRSGLGLIFRYYQDPKNYNLIHPGMAVLNRFRRIATSRMADLYHFEAPVEGEKFVFFPLHLQPEMTTAVLAPFCTDQLALLENIAKSLPIDHRLYVKEHKASLGRRPLSYYRRLRSIPNVRLISPYWDSHDLIKRSAAAVVISSTVGWEALLYERPVITFGEAFYNAFDLVYRARALPDLPGLLSHAIRSFRPDRELLLKFVAAALEGTYEGDACYIPHAKNPCLHPQNIRRVARAVINELGLEEALQAGSAARCAVAAGGSRE